MEPVSLLLENGIARIRFHVPPVNALPTDALNALEKYIRQASTSPDIKALILESEGKTFCAGASFDELIRLEQKEAAIDFFGGFGRVMLAMKSAPVPVITRIQGKTVGGGVGLVAVSDLALAVETAAFKLSEISIGIGPFVISPAIRRRGGPSLLHKMSWQPWRWFTAFDMKKSGLIDIVFPDLHSLDEYLDQIADYYQKYDSTAIARWKKALWSDADDWELLFSELARESADLLLREPVKKYLASLKKN